MCVGTSVFVTDWLLLSCSHGTEFQLVKTPHLGWGLEEDPNPISNKGRSNPKKEVGIGRREWGDDDSRERDLVTGFLVRGGIRDEDPLGLWVVRVEYKQSPSTFLQGDIRETTSVSVAWVETPSVLTQFYIDLFWRIQFELVDRIESNFTLDRIRTLDDRTTVVVWCKIV